MPFEPEYLASIRNQFTSYKNLGEKALAQVTEDELYYQPNPESNSIAIIMQHLHGNMLSRFTNFLTEDGEKPWRQRDNEFNSPAGWHPAGELMKRWAEGWKTVFDSIDELKPEQVGSTVTIRDEPHLVLDALNRQLAHYASHVGQIVYLAKMIRGQQWLSPSIPKGASAAFNESMANKFKAS